MNFGLGRKNTKHKQHTTTASFVQEAAFFAGLECGTRADGLLVLMFPRS